MTTNVAIACQGGGSHTAFTAGVLKRLLTEVDAADEYELVSLSGSSGGAVCATAAWFGLVSDDHTPESVLDDLWADIAASSLFERATNDWLVWTTMLDASGFPTAQVSPYQNPFADQAQQAFQDLLERHVDFERFGDLATEDTPRLTVGTVDVTAGQFETFTDESVDSLALLASSAVPTLYPAVEIHGHTHWDGLFAHNPPIRDLFDVPPEHKPDELWLVQINPQRVDDDPTGLREIYDRRTELSANISLTEQLHFVEQVNEWLDAGHLPEAEYRHTEIHRIELQKQLSVSSKFDRSPGFIEDLQNRGVERAQSFLENRAID
ncbi:patatin-like phospholipase family protein [Haloarchaeobius sp. DFWS5]|uniref:patatin-like phospholipase family protein n=1 Tax=Haloarchaeobius sp. DFWS5 TaxID=3446114 RepID=UPI003EBBE06E